MSEITWDRIKQLDPTICTSGDVPGELDFTKMSMQ